MTVDARVAPGAVRLCPALAGVSARARWLAGTLTLGIGYYGLGQLGQALHYTGDAQAVWLPVGWAAAILYLGDFRWLPGAVAADGAVGLTSSHLLAWATPEALATTAGNMAEITVAALLMRHLLGRRTTLERAEQVVLMLAAAAVGTAISATIGVTTLWVAGDIDGSGVASLWRTWWLGDTCGAVLLIPLLVTWIPFVVGWRDWRSLDLGRTPRQLEGLALAVVVVALSVSAFDTSHPLTYAVFPALIWAALRFGQPGGTLAVTIAALTAVSLTAHNVGPFVQQSISDTTLATQLYILIGAVSTLFLGAAVSDRARAARELVESQQREAQQEATARQRIARDLHDSVTQTLFSLSLHARVAEHELAGSAGAEDGRSAVQEVSLLARGALAEMRALIVELHSTALAEDGLVVALERHAAAISARDDLPIVVVGPLERLPLAPATEEQLYRLGQEAIANVVKHAGASRVDVSIDRENWAVRLCIADDGRGFDPEATFAGHLGLSTMRSRAEEIGATLEIRSAPQRGTTVLVEVPAST